MRATQIVRDVMRAYNRDTIYTNKVANPGRRTVKCYEIRDEKRNNQMIRDIGKALCKAGYSGYTVRQTEVPADFAFDYGSRCQGAVIYEVPFN
jgi:hypothetical protein